MSIDQEDLPSNEDTGAEATDQQVEPTEPKERPLTPREIAMNAITVVRSDDGVVDADPEPVQPTSAAEEQLAAQLDTPQVLTDGLDKFKARTKINGVEKEVTVEELVRQYQINGAAEARLQEAGRKLAEANARLAEAANTRVSVDGQGASEDHTSTQTPEHIARAKEIADALVGGDAEKAAQAVALLLEGRSAGPTLDHELLAAQLTPAIRQQFVVETALERFVQANAEMLKDPYLVDLTNRFLDEEVAAGKAYPDALETAGQRTKGWLAQMGVKAAPEPTPTSSRDKKLERKAAMDNVTALNKTASSTQEPAQTVSSVIAEMQKARGLG